MHFISFNKHLSIAALFCVFAIIFFFAVTVSGAVNANKKTNEGAGLLFSDLNGALPKALWRDQPRSEIIYLIKNLPAHSNLRSVQDIKRNMLLSYYDTSLIDDDVPIKKGDDLLTLRLFKLLEMGLWEDAFTLYTKTTKDPGDSAKLAEVGVLLILVQKGLSTACLEEKVLGSRFPNNQFWQQISNICAIELGIESATPPEFTQSPVLQSIFYDKKFNIPARNINTLKKLTPLELALVSLKGRINYKQIDLPKNTPPYIIKTFLKDSRFPTNHREELNKAAQRIALAPLPKLTDEQTNQAKNAKNLSQSLLISLIAKKLQLGQEISKSEIARGLELAPTNAENYFYFQVLNVIKFIDSTMEIPEITPENLTLGIDVLSTKNIQKTNLIKTLLDKPALFSNNLAIVYEKQLSLTPEGHYVMPTGGLIKWLTATQEHQFIGLSLLIILSNIENDAYATTVESNLTNNNFNMLKSLSTVGLIDQAHHIAKEELANLMGQYK